MIPSDLEQLKDRRDTWREMADLIDLGTSWMPFFRPTAVQRTLRRCADDLDELLRGPLKDSVGLPTTPEEP